MPASAHPTRLAPAAAALLLALLLLLAAPARTFARAHSAACSSRTTSAHHTRCARHPHKSTRKATHHHAKAKHAAKSHAKTTAPAPRLTPALCEDETLPSRAGSSFSCDDGSEPGCEDEAAPIRSGHTLQCVIPVETSEEGCEEQEGPESFCLTGSSGSGEPVCEDGSTPGVLTNGGAATCEDGSEPVCEDGSTPIPSHGHTLVCENAFANTDAGKPALGA